jgi:hypothetical protein
VGPGLYQGDLRESVWRVGVRGSQRVLLIAINALRKVGISTRFSASEVATAADYQDCRRPLSPSMRSLSIGVSFIIVRPAIRSLTEKRIGKQGDFGPSAARSPVVVIYITLLFVSVLI